MGVFKNIEQRGGVFAQAANNIPEAPAKKQSLVGQSIDALTNTGVGIGSAVGKTVLGIPEAVARVSGATKTADAIKNVKESIYQKPFEDKLSTVSGKVGTGIGTVATFVAPGGLASKGEIAINVLSKGLSSPLGAAALRIGGKAAVQGLSAGAVDLASTGGDLQSAKNTALTAGIIRGGMASVGETARALKLPERMYSTIFKNSTRDMLAELKANGINNLQRTNPEKYAEFVKSGIIKTTKGVPVINETLAEKAIKKGLKGSLDGMAKTTVHGILDSEHQAQALAKNYKGTVDLSEPQFTNILKKIGTDYEDVGFGEISNQAKTLHDVIKSNNGKVSAQTALEVRRLLDRARLASSFNSNPSSLSMSQQNLKTLADTARNRVNSVPGMGKIMENYSFNIDALEAIAKDAARRGNNNIISLIDGVFLGGGLAGGEPATALGMGVVRKLSTIPRVLTTLGQSMSRPNLGSAGSAVVGSVSSSGQKLNQTNQSGQ